MRPPLEIHCLFGIALWVIADRRIVLRVRFLLIGL